MGNIVLRIILKPMPSFFKYFTLLPWYCWILYVLIAEKCVQVAISTTTNTFEVHLGSKEEESSQDVVLSGKLFVADSYVLPADIQEYNPGMEEVTEKEVYSVLSNFGLHLGPKFQCIKKFFIGESGM